MADPGASSHHRPSARGTGVHSSDDSHHHGHGHGHGHHHSHHHHHHHSGRSSHSGHHRSSHHDGTAGGHTHSRSAAPKIVPPRTLGSAVFALTSLWLCRLCVRAGWLRNIWSDQSDFVFKLTRDDYVLPGRGQLCLGFRLMALLALLWCVWAWRRERGPLWWLNLLLVLAALSCALSFQG